MNLASKSSPTSTGFESRLHSEVSAEIGGLPPISQEPRSVPCPSNRTMNHDFVTVDMRGLKAALVARARSDRTTVSTVVRAAVMHELGLVDAGEQGPSMATFPSAASVKLSIRMTRDEVARLDVGARAAGLSRAAYLAGLMDNVPVLMGGNRAESITALVASNAALADLARDIRHMAQLLRQGDGQTARLYRQRLDSVDHEVRAHLRLASKALTDLQPQRASGGPTRSTRS